MIPNYLLISKIGLRDCIWGVALPQFADVLKYLPAAPGHAWNPAGTH
ncbi:MAG: hypothetical protein ACLR8P_04645 [Clostridium fessum]